MKCIHVIPRDAILNLCFLSIPDGGYGNSKSDCLTGKWMITIQSQFPSCNSVYNHCHLFTTFVFKYSFSTDLLIFKRNISDIIGKSESRIILTKTLIGIKSYMYGFSDFMALQIAFNLFKQNIISTMYITNGYVRAFKHIIC
uniref:Uncharacterized protein n=1 Tax=Candidatus Kentrum sp. LFY TaxID=2126342 RepID=A0A450UP80_9GAMM|nr:MAG: hypothetical protein BECKLFY1418A_GA0070994_103912 [Candidatus Kentron sp. LFY]